MKPLTPSSPHVIILVGTLGAGKTQFGEHFAKTFNAPFINHEGFRELSGAHERGATKLTAHLLEEFLKTQRTIIFEGPTDQRTFRQGLVRKLSAAGYAPLIVWVQTDPIEAKRRALKSRSSITSDDFDAHLKRFQPPTAAEKPVVISGKHTYASQVKMVLKHLAGPREDHEETPPPRSRSSHTIIVR